MGYTNKTSHYDLPQWIAGDKPSWLGDVNTAMLNIDTAIAGADASASAAESSAASANAQVQAQVAKIAKNTTDIQALTENLANTQGEVNNVKTTAEGALPKSGGTMTGNLILNAAPTSDLQAATKKYVDDNSGKGALMLSGGTMTGPLTLSGAPTADLMAATKKYVDDHAGGGVAITVLTNADPTKVAGCAYILGGVLVAFGTINLHTTTLPIQTTIFSVSGNPLNLTRNETTQIDRAYYQIKDATITYGSFTATYDGTNTLIKNLAAINPSVDVVAYISVCGSIN